MNIVAEIFLPRRTECFQITSTVSSGTHEGGNVVPQSLNPNCRLRTPRAYPTFSFLSTGRGSHGDKARGKRWMHSHFQRACLIDPNLGGQTVLRRRKLTTRHVLVFRMNHLSALTALSPVAELPSHRAISPNGCRNLRAPAQATAGTFLECSWTSCTRCLQERSCNRPNNCRNFPAIILFKLPRLWYVCFQKRNIRMMGFFLNWLLRQPGSPRIKGQKIH